MKICPLLIIYFMLLLSGCRQNSDSDQTNAIEDELQSFDYLNEHVGQTPTAVNLWTTEPLQTELKKVLGGKYATFIKHMENAKVLKRDRVIYTIAALPDSATHGYTLALFDTTDIQAEIFFLQKDTILEYASEKSRLYWPDECRNLMYNYQGWHVYEGLLPCADCPGILTTLAIVQNSTDDKIQYFLQQKHLDTLDDNEVFQQRGAGLLLSATYSDTTALIYQLGNTSTEKLISFLKLDEAQLELLDRDLKRISTDHNIKLNKIN